MISFELSDEQKGLRDTAHRYAQDIRKVAAQYDRDGTYPLEELREAWKLGLSCEVIPEEYGGLGLGCLDLCVIDEELAWGCLGFWVGLTVNNLALNAIVIGGSEEQKKKFLPPFMDEFRMVSYCQSEPDAGSDPAGMRTTAIKKGDHYVINGSKQWITNGGYADLFIVFATVDPQAGHRGITAFIMEKGTDGLEVGKKEDKMGQRASDTRAVTFTDCAVPEANRIGGEGQGFKLAMKLLDRSRPTIGAASVGLARAALEHAVEYAQQRKQFSVPISSHQAIQFMLADMAKDIDASRWLAWRAAALVDAGQRNTKEAAMAKCFGADTAMRVTTDAVQIFGGYGYTKEYPVEKLMRDAKVLQIYEGTNQIQRMIIAREILRS